MHWLPLLFLLLSLTIVGLFVFQPRYIMSKLARAHGVRFFFNPIEQQKLIALTIDDTPAHGNGMTSDILTLLAKYKISATFFVIGSQGEAYPHLLKDIYAAGHELGNHDMHDKVSVTRDPAIFENYLVNTHEIIKPYLRRPEGKTHWFRPGCGWYSPRLLKQLQDNNHTCILGDVYPHDVGIRWPWLISQFILWHTRPGSVIIIHDRRPGLAIETLKYVVPELSRQGYQFVTLSQMEQSEHSRLTF